MNERPRDDGGVGNGPDDGSGNGSPPENWPRRLQPLLMALSEGELDASSGEELGRLLTSSPNAMDLYCRYVELDAMFLYYGNAGVPMTAGLPSLPRSLEESGAVEPERTVRTPARVKSSDPARESPATAHRTAIWLAAAACLLVSSGIGLTFAIWSHGEPLGVAKLASVEGVRWASEAPPAHAQPGSALLGGERFQLESGQIEVVFEDGTSCVATGPADIRIDARDRVHLDRGTLRTRIGVDGKGFTVATERGHVVDLGTDFGVRVTANLMDVVVFQGLVQLEPHREDDRVAEPIPIGESDGLRVTDGGIRPLSVIDETAYPNGAPIASGPTIIASVVDSRRDPNGDHPYRVVREGLRNGALAYADRFHRWCASHSEGVPDFLVGADYALTFNADKGNRSITRDVRMPRGGHLYVLFDDRVERPGWLTSRFRDTGYDLGVQEHWRVRDGGAGREVQINPGHDQPFSVWHRRVPAGKTVRLGGVDSGSNLASMYGIAATPLDRPPPIGR